MSDNQSPKVNLPDGTTKEIKDPSLIHVWVKKLNGEEVTPRLQAYDKRVFKDVAQRPGFAFETVWHPNKNKGEIPEGQDNSEDDQDQDQDQDKPLTEKQQLQADYKELTGEDAPARWTVDQLKQAIEEL